MADQNVSGEVEDASHHADTDTDTEHEHDSSAAVAVTGAGDGGKGTLGKVLAKALYVAYETPAFLFLLGFFVIVKVSVDDMRAVLLSLDKYEITWVEMMYALAAFIALGEIYKISEPGARNTKEAILIAVTAVVYLLFFALGAAQVPVLSTLFSNSEFLIMTAIAMAGAIIALIINPRTAQRTLTGGAGE